MLVLRGTVTKGLSSGLLSLLAQRVPPTGFWLLLELGVEAALLP